MKATKRTNKTVKTVTRKPVPTTHKKDPRKTSKPTTKRNAASVKKTIPNKTVAHDKVEEVKKGEGKRIVMGLPAASEAKEAIEALMQNEKGISYLKKNVSRSITDVISLLNVARTDDYIAEKLGIKINAVRRMLNIMQNYGITNYYISKNKNGWLSFAWYINTSKLPSFLEYVRSVESERSMIEENCNDYFVCNSCYKENKLIFTFDAAYEAGFSCNACGKNLERLGGKGDVEKLMNDNTPETTLQ